MHGKDSESLKSYRTILSPIRGPNHLTGVAVALILLGFIVLFYFRYIIFINGFVMLDNFTRPYNISQLNYLPIFYDKFQYFGSVLSSPFGQIDYIAIGEPLFALPSILFGLTFGEKIFAIVTTFIYAISFFTFSKIFASSYVARIASTIFFLFNPFTIAIYVYGDFQQLIFISFSMFSLFFIFKAINPNTLKLNPYYFLLSCILIPFSWPFLQIVLISFLFAFLILLYSIFFNKSKVALRYEIWKFIVYGLFWFFSVLIVSLPFILPYLYSPTSYLPNSVSALPISQFESSGLSFFKIITLEAYPPYLSWIIVKQFYGTMLYNVWISLIACFVVFILFSGIFLFDKRLVLFSIILIFISILGAQTDGPMGPFTIYLYKHLIGYQAINYPYFWVWLVNVPVISIMVAIFMGDILNGVPDNFKFSRLRFGRKNIFYHFRSFLRSLVINRMKTIRKSIFTFIAVILVIIIAMPIATQGYYTHGNVSGLGASSVPYWFDNLDHELVNLTAKNNSAVIFNTINSYFFFGNNSDNATNNLLQIFPQFKTVDLSSYIPNYNTVTNFFYWFYYTFYTNQTKYSAQILSSVGVQYFVDIYNANSGGYPYFVPWSYNVNASSILLHQPGWERIAQTQNFSIFKNEYYNHNEYYTNNLSLILGNYNTLNEMAYLGINLANVTPMFPTDLINGQNIQQILNHTDLVVMSGYNSIFDLMLSTSNSPVIYPVNYVDGEQSDSSIAWINSERSNNYPYYATLIPFAETSGNNSLNIPLTVNDSGHYSLFLKVAFDNTSVKGGVLNILVNSKLTKSLNTSRDYENETNGFLWVQVNVTLLKGNNVLSLQSRSGFNAVSEVSVLNRTELKKATTFTRNFLSKERNNIIQIYQPQQMIPSNNTGYYYGSRLGDKFPNGKYLYLSGLHGNNSMSINSAVSFNGTLLVSMLSDAYARFNITYGNLTTTIGVDPSIYMSSSNASPGSVLLPVHRLKAARIHITAGTSYVGIIALLPSNYGFFASPIVHANLGNITYRGIYGGITKFNISEVKGSDYTTISGSFTYKNVSDYFPISLVFAGDYPYNSSVIFLSDISGPATLELNGMSIESTDFYGNPLISPPLNDQYQGRPSNFQLNFVPDHFHSNISYNVSFVLTVLGYSNYPQQMVRYSPVLRSGPNISYTTSGYDIKGSSSGMLILRVPFSSGLESNVKLNSAGNGLMTLITQSDGKVIRVSADTFALFMVGVYIAAAFSAIYLGLYLFLRNRKKKIK